MGNGNLSISKTKSLRNKLESSEIFWFVEANHYFSETIPPIDPLETCLKFIITPEIRSK